jgi:hypothetical protein
LTSVCPSRTSVLPQVTRHWVPSRFRGNSFTPKGRGARYPTLIEGGTQRRSSSEVQASERDQCEGQNRCRQNSEREPLPKPGTRPRQPQHVSSRVSRMDVVPRASVSSSVRHAKILATKAAYFLENGVLLSIQNGTDTTHDCAREKFRRPPRNQRRMARVRQGSLPSPPRRTTPLRRATPKAR